MSKNWAIIILSEFLILQQAFAGPLVKREVTDVPENAATPQELLLNHTLAFMTTEFLAFQKLFTTNGKQVLQAALRELNALPTKSDALQVNISRIADWVHQGETPAELTEDDKQHLQRVSLQSLHTLKLTAIMSDYEAMPNDAELTETLKQALDGAGYKKFIADCEARHLELIKKFKIYTQTFFDTLPEPEKPKFAKWLTWFDEFKKVDNPEEKFQEFLNKL